MAVALEVGLGMNKKKRAWGGDEQKLLDMMMGHASAYHTRTLDLLGSSPSSPHQFQLELGREQALPLGWEKRLDLKSGRVYFINWNTGTTTLDDPRPAMHKSVHRDKESGVDLKLKLCLMKDGLENVEEEKDIRPECLWLLSSNPSSRQEAAEDAESDAGSNNWMLSSCKRCFMYVIISPSDPKCPKCGSNVFLKFSASKKCKVQLHNPNVQSLPSTNKRPFPILVD